MHALPLSILILSVGLAWGQRSLFDNPFITSQYSPLLQEKNAQADSLLPALDGDKAMAELLRVNPGLWSLGRLDRQGKMLTRLHVDLQYLDGIREEPFCRLDQQKSSQPGEWFLSIGVDFTSGGSNTVGIHVQQCLEMVRHEMGYLMQDSTGKVFTVPPKKVIEEIAQSHIPNAIDPDLQQRLLKAHQGVELTGNCPTDIEAYAILLDVWKQVQNIPMDIILLDQHLNKAYAGNSSAQSCAFSREWNRRYHEEASFSCDFDANRCTYIQSEDGVSHWKFHEPDNTLHYQGKKILFIPWGPQSIHSGGNRLDLRMIPLSSRLFLEAYLGLDGQPVSLGLIITPQPESTEEE